ncbi:MAG: hypothetical protein KDK66_03630 [Deltaproteobacteria bacterium]|nr:hypothetical protein [Deltaproteobacteria bacterium]
MINRHLALAIAGLFVAFVLERSQSATLIWLGPILATAILCIEFADHIRELFVKKKQKKKEGVKDWPVLLGWLLLLVVTPLIFLWLIYRQGQLESLLSF